jgi:hypothetical protein
VEESKFLSHLRDCLLSFKELTSEITEEDMVYLISVRFAVDFVSLKLLGSLSGPLVDPGDDCVLGATACIFNLLAITKLPRKL